MKKLLLTLCLLCLTGMAYADAAFEGEHPRDENGRFVAVDKCKLKAGPLELQPPLMDTHVVYLFNGLSHDVDSSLVGAETTIITVWKRISGTIGIVTSPVGKGIFFSGMDLNVGNPFEQIGVLSNFRIGGFGAYDSRNHAWMAGPKASIALW